MTTAVAPAAVRRASGGRTALLVVLAAAVVSLACLLASLAQGTATSPPPPSPAETQALADEYRALAPHLERAFLLRVASTDDCRWLAERAAAVLAYTDAPRADRNARLDALAARMNRLDCPLP